MNGMVLKKMGERRTVPTPQKIWNGQRTISWFPKQKTADPKQAVLWKETAIPEPAVAQLRVISDTHGTQQAYIVLFKLSLQ